MQTIFLIGGGRDLQGARHTFRPFLEAARGGRRMKIAFIIAVEDETALSETSSSYIELFEALGVSGQDICLIPVSAAAPLRADLLKACNPTGIFVGGGCTPLYQSSLCGDKSWLEYISEAGIPYAGFSAGAAIAPQNAIVGGWKVRCDDREIAVLDPDAGEDLEWVEVRQGLGLVQFGVDVHASQWGTLNRLMQAVDQHWVQDGWAIDENTMLRVQGEQVQVYGLGHAYHVQSQSTGVLSIRMVRAGVANDFKG